MAPEIIIGRSWDCSADIWSLDASVEPYSTELTTDIRGTHELTTLWNERFVSEKFVVTHDWA